MKEKRSCKSKGSGTFFQRPRPFQVDHKICTQAVGYYSYSPIMMDCPSKVSKASYGYDHGREEH